MLLCISMQTWGIYKDIFAIILDIGMEAVEAAEVTEKITGEGRAAKEEITLETPLMSTGKIGIIKPKH